MIIIIALAISNFYVATQPTIQKNVLLSNSIPRFVLGIIINGVNPMQIPFWFGWTTVLFARKILLPRWKHYNIYSAGAAIGMFMATLIFIFGGRLIADKISHNQDIVYFIIGGIFTITGLIQIWKMVKKKDVEHKMEHPEEITAPFEETVEEINKDNVEQNY